MNALKFLAVGFAVCAIVVGARAEDTDLAKMLVGKWEITKSHEGGPPAGSVVEFTKDGTIKMTGKKDDKEFTREGKYKVEPHKFIVTLKNGDNEEMHTITVVKITDKEMTVKNDAGQETECKKK